MIEYFVKLRKQSWSGLLFSLLLGALVACDLSGPNGPKPEAANNFADLEVGQEWLYAKWEKRHAGERVFTGDTVSVSVTSIAAGLATFFERTLHVESPTSADSSIFQFEVSDSLFRQVGSNSSRLFGFVLQHDGRLFLSGIDSNPVMIDLETSLFLLREQTGQSKFIGRSTTTKHPLTAMNLAILRSFHANTALLRPSFLADSVSSSRLDTNWFGNSVVGNNSGRSENG